MVKRRLIVWGAGSAVVVALLYTAHATNLVGVLLEMHGSIAAPH